MIFNATGIGIVLLGELRSVLICELGMEIREAVPHCDTFSTMDKVYNANNK